MPDFLWMQLKMYTMLDLASRKGDNKGVQEIEQLYDEQVKKVYKYFYIQCLNRHVAEDLTSQTFVKFIDKANTETIEDTKKYLYGIMRNVWADHLRSKYKEIVDSVEIIDDFEAFIDDKVQQYESKDLYERAAIYIDRLPKQQRKVAKMRMLEQQSVGEVAVALGKNKSYVKTTQNRAIKSLKNMVKQPEFFGGLS